MRISLLMLLAACHKGGDSVDESDVETDSPPQGPIRSCAVSVGTDVPNGVNSIEIAGQWGDFAPLGMEFSEDGSTASVDLGELRPGTYGYKFIYDGVWEETPPDVYTTWNDGFENRALVVGDCELPDLQAVSASASADGHVVAQFQVFRGADGAAIDSVEATIGGEAVPSEFDARTGVITIDVTGVSAGKRSVRVSVVDTAGRSPEGGDGFVPLWVESEPFEWQSGMMYFVFLDRFADGGSSGLPDIGGASDPGTNYMGGDLVGAKRLLDDGYFDRLGIRTIWLSPVNQNPDEAFIGSGGYYYTGYHGYWPTRGTEVEDRFGTSDVASDRALHEFIDTAHDHGIRIVLDTVLNHVHDEHEIIGEHPDWFTADACVCTTDAGACNWDTNPIGCWFTDYLPDMDYKNHDLVDFSVDSARFWVEEYDVDGFRVDAAKHMDHVVMRTLALTLRDRYEVPGGAPFWLVGETFTGQGGQGLIMNYVAPYELDGQFDFPLLYPIRDGIGRRSGFRGLASEVQSSNSAYGDSVQWMSPFLGNHDVARFVTEVGGCDQWELFGGCTDVLASGSQSTISDPEWDLVNELSMSYAFVATQPGIPMLYYGDEIGLAGSTDPDNRRMMQFDELSMSQSTVLSRFQELGRVRRETPALWRGDRTELWVDDTLYVYGRNAGNGEVAIVAMAQSERAVDVPIPTGLGLEGRTLRNALVDGREWTVTGGYAHVELHPWEYVVMVPE